MKDESSLHPVVSTCSKVSGTARSALQTLEVSRTLGDNRYVLWGECFHLPSGLRVCVPAGRATDWGCPLLFPLLSVTECEWAQLMNVRVCLVEINMLFMFCAFILSCLESPSEINKVLSEILYFWKNIYIGKVLGTNVYRRLRVYNWIMFTEAWRYLLFWQMVAPLQ